MIPRTPTLFSWLFPKVLFRVKTNAPHIYLSFDDGPEPELTPFVLDCLAAYSAKATFFTVGENVERYPELMERIKKEGHSSGHHTHKHVNALHVSTAHYVTEVLKGAEKNPSPLFRPPYGKLTWKTYRALKNKYRIVLWDILAEEYEEKYTAEQCIRKIVQHARKGSIIVLHDNVKCKEKVQQILPEILKKLQEKGYSFQALPTT